MSVEAVLVMLAHVLLSCFLFHEAPENCDLSTYHFEELRKCSLCFGLQTRRNVLIDPLLSNVRKFEQNKINSSI